MDKIELAKIVWNYLHLGNPIEKCDCILGLGCYDLSIPKKCATLYHQGYSDTIIFSGGLGKITKDIWKKTEAEKFAEIAIDLGVPAERIYIENKSTNTGDNFRFTLDLIKKENLTINSFLVVHKPYMERRCYAAFHALVPNKICFVTSPDISFEEYLTHDQTGKLPYDEIINLMVGDLQRIQLYPRIGWQIKQEIPTNVMTAYKELIRLGYTKHLLSEI